MDHAALRIIDPDILDTEEVARALRCAAQTVQSIPEDELPRYPGPGRKTLYLREDLVRYVRSLRKIKPDIEKFL